jgi:hypothetical protein
MGVTTIQLSAWSRRSNFGRYSALVDDCDSAWALQYDWSADVRRLRSAIIVYAYRWIRDGNKRDSRKHKIYMHREIAVRMFGAKPDCVDHIDGNGLNNSRSNIRSASRLGNAANTMRRLSNPSGFKGVCWHPGTQKWRARLKDRQLGLFDSPEDAAKAYDLAAREAFGEFARLNFPEAA